MATGEIDRVQIRIPPFWDDDPEVWFAQVESQFELGKIVADDTKYGYVAGNLEPRFAKEVRDILTAPPPTGKYDKLKVELIRRLSASQENRIRQLLEREELGDRKPSQFLRHLRHLAGTAVPDTLLRSLWLGRLPNNVQAILATQQKAGLNEIAELADAVMNITAPTINEVAGSDVIKHLTAEIEQLKIQLRKQEDARPKNFRHRPRSRSRDGNRTRNQTQSRNRTYDTCWFHFKYGKEARNCRPPCKFKPEGNEQGSQ